MSKNANLRICASCERVFWGKDKPCPNCGFAHYGAVWAVGWKRALIYWITKHKRKTAYKQNETD